MRQKKEISIVIPVFNSQDSIEELVTRLENTINNMKVEYEIIFVDDSSKDNSWNILKTIQKKYPHVSIIRLAKNYGQHNTTMCGFKEAIGATIITLDDDLEHRPEDIPKLYADFKSKNYDILYAFPKARKKSFQRNLFGFLWYKGSQTLNKGVGRASSYRILNKNTVECLIQHQEPFMFIESIIDWYTEHIGYKEVDFEKRKHGKSNYSILELFSLNNDIGMHYDTHILKFMKNFGVIVFFGSMLLIVYYIFKKIFGSPIPGYTSLIIVSLFSSGSILWGMGYLGIYIGKMFRILNKEPQYQIAEKLDHRE